MSDFDSARDKVLMGAKREEFITDKDKRATAYHEIGHALVSWLTPTRWARASWVMCCARR